MDGLDGAAVDKSDKFFEVSGFPVNFVRAVDCGGVGEGITGRVEVEVRVQLAVGSIMETWDESILRFDEHPLFCSRHSDKGQRDSESFKV